MKQKTTILKREMDRKEFLKYVGASVVALTGVTGMINALKGKRSTSASTYGSSAYGGRRK